MTLIGRPTELDAIEGVVDAARGGHSGVLVLRGPAGIGKTALLEHAVAVASDVRVLRAEGVEAESELAFAGLHQLLWPLRDAPPLEPLFRLDSTGVADRFAVAAGTLGVLAEAADEQPVLCAVDDVQWLDRPSAEALGFVARRLGAEPIAVIAAIRDPAPLPAGLARCPQLVLGGLPPEAARRLLGEELAPADRERVLEAADGNPLALLELPRGPLGSGGEMNSLERSFADRIAALPADARDAIVVAAADDDPGGATALRALAAIGDLASAEAGGLLWVDGGRIAFRHPLVRSAAYGLATFDERRRAHAALAEALTSPADADRRAWHRAAAAAAPDADVAAELDRSAERARARGGHAAAGAALERAARLTDDDPLRARRLVAAAESARLAGDAVHAEGLAAEALALGDPGTVAEATAIRGAVRVHAGAVADGERDLRAAASVLEAAQPRRALRIGLLAAEAAAIDGRHEHASDVGRWTSSLAVGDDPAERALVAFASAIGNLFSGATAAARANVTEACVLAPRSRDPQALIWAGIGAVYVGDIAAARRAFADAVAGARERGAVGAVAYAMQLAAYVELLDGRFALAGTDAAESLALAEEAGDDAAVSHCRAMLAWRAAVRGDVDDAEALAAQALAWAGARPQSVAAESAGRALALADLGASRFDAALDRLLALRAHPGRRMLAVGDLVEAAVGCGRADAAREPLAALEAWTAATGSAWGAATVAGAAVQLAADAEAAEAAYAAAVAAHEEIALPFDRARVELRLGEHLRRARRRVDARRHLRAALDLFAHTGAAPWEQRAAAELRATGETARRRDASTLDDLTPQELQIARLAAEGATNRDIAARLFLSPRTVEYHLRKVFQKLGVTSRTQLAGLDW